ncbi:MAG: GNAT family N-acetyltransferase [Lacibacter sp.]
MLHLNFHPFPELKTERLLLRKMTVNDSPELFFLRSDKQVLEFIGKEPAANEEAVKEFIKTINLDIDANQAIMWGIALQENPSILIGNICYWRIQSQHHRAEIGYTLHPGYWRKGIMKEAVLKVMEFGFEEMKLHSIEARISSGNLASAAILRSTGFVQEGYLKEEFCFRNKFYDTIIFSKLK